MDKLGEKPATGSARSACGVNLYEALSNCREHLIKFGGHPAAAGICIEPGNIDAFREAFGHYVREQVAIDELVPEIEIDAEVPLSQLTLKSLYELESLAPFGQGNPRPIMCATEVRLAVDPKTMGSEDRHLALQLVQHNVRMRAVGFGKGEWAAELQRGEGIYDFAFKPVVNEYQGRRNVELHLIDYRKTKSAVAKY
jgi:single-stranded-DNA-specific exonuclease